MAGGEREKVTIGGHQWEVLRQNETPLATDRCYPRSEVERLGGDPRDVERYAVARSGNRYWIDNAQ